MTDTLTRKKRSALMSRIRAVDTKPELFLRRALHAKGYRFRTHLRELPGRPGSSVYWAARRNLRSWMLLAPTRLQENL